jgi:hypothetical protein
MATYETAKYGVIPIGSTQVADGSVTNTEFQYINTLSSNAQTQLAARAALAGATFTGGVRVNDSLNLNIGSSTDLVLSHNATDSKINNTTGELVIGGNTIKIKNQAESTTYLSTDSTNGVKMPALPTSDPGVAGALWRDGTTVKVSI